MYIVVTLIIILTLIMCTWWYTSPKDEYEKYVVSRLCIILTALIIWIGSSYVLTRKINAPSETGALALCAAVIVPTYYITNQVGAVGYTNGPVPSAGGKWMRAEREATSDRAKQIAAATFALGTLLVSAQTTHPRLVEVALTPMLWGLLFCVFVAVPAYLNRGEDEHPFAVAAERSSLSLSGSFISLAVALALCAN